MRREVRLKWILNKMKESNDSSKYINIMNEKNVIDSINYHKSFPQYQVTPLISLKNMAKYLGIKSLFVKDESYRFGLNAFKVLGGSYAIGRYISNILNIDISNISYNMLIDENIKNKIGQLTFYSATDGNHGRGVAWSANKIGQKCVIHMPKGTTQTRLNNIKKLGATVDITDLNYDDCVRLSNKEAQCDDHGIIIQDTAWDGYEEIPIWIMQGYGTLSIEADRQILAEGCDRPTHIFIQAGVGSLAASVIGYFFNKYRENPPIFIVVEACAAACLYKSAVKCTGRLSDVKGDLKTIMAGLACGEGNIIAWDILKKYCSVFVSAPDWMSANGMRIYGVPLKGDSEIISGESGAVTMGVLASIIRRIEYSDLKEILKLDENSEVLLISTEGNTDPKRFRSVVWDGLYGNKSEPGDSSIVNEEYIGH